MLIVQLINFSQILLKIIVHIQLTHVNHFQSLRMENVLNVLIKTVTIWDIGLLSLKILDLCIWQRSLWNFCRILFCHKSYQISLKSGYNGFATARGKFLIGYNTSRTLFNQIVWDDGKTVLESEKKLSKLFNFETDLEEIECICCSESRNYK